jgi:SpoIID/LytB domain protein
VLGADALEVSPAADAWVNRQRPDANNGLATVLRAANATSETLIKFNVAAWAGMPIASLTLTLRGVQGDGSALRLDETAVRWKERGVTWRSRPQSLRQLSAAPALAAGTVSFDVKSLFPSGLVDRSSISLRVRSTSSILVTFGSRETPSGPRLRLSIDDSGPPGQPRLIADTWADSAAASRNHGTAKLLLSDGRPRAEAFVMFDVAGVLGRSYESLKLQLQIRTAGGPGVTVYRVQTGWSEGTLNWQRRPANKAQVAQIDMPVASGPLIIDVSGAFGTHTVQTSRVAFRIVSSNSSGIDFSSREGSSPARLVFTPTAGPTPTPATPTPATPTPPPTPTATPTASPTPTPTATPTPTPTPTLSPTPSPSATVTPEACPYFYFDGRGTDHGVGLSQQGARGRAAAGQTYDQILNFYYTGVEFSTVDGSTPIRVLLGEDFWPSTELPARVTGLIGGWQSDVFPGVVFPQGSYVEMWPEVPHPTPTPTPTPTPSPTPSVTPTPNPCATPTPEPSATPTPTPSATPTPDPTQDPDPSATPTPDPTNPPPPETWIATVHDATGAVVASAVTDDLVVSAAAPDGVLEMRYRDQLVKYRQYRGQLRLLVRSTGLETINILPLESYLRGVVPAEVPATWPIEAVKAQAVAARTYAWSRRKDWREWDVLPTAANQVYGGYQHEYPASDSAVSATANLVLTYEGKVISALYHAAAGGYTENSEYAFVNDRGDPGNRVAYLRGKPDVDENGVPYDISAGSYAWTSGQFTLPQLSVIFSNNPLTDVGEILNITYWRGVSGRVYRVLLEGSKGSKTVSGGRFKNTYNDYKITGKNMKSTLFFLTLVDP